MNQQAIEYTKSHIEMFLSYGKYFSMENFFTRDDYLSFWNKKKNQKFQILNMPWRYDMSIISTYAEKLVFFGQIFNEQGAPIHVGLIQFSDDLHARLF